MHDSYLSHLRAVIEQIRAEGFYKSERVIESPQSPQIRLADGREVLNFCANNYLGLADDARLVQAAKDGLDTYGFGMASVRFICGTQSVHKELESALAAFLTTDDSILYSSCFDANGGLFETLLNEADGAGVRFKLIATDGVFSMDGTVAKLATICMLAEQYRAMVMVDDSHAVGFIGAAGRGTPELCAVEGKVDIFTGTLGKALGGASGGYIAGRKEIIALLRQRSRPYLFSNTLAPSIAAASLKVLDLLAGAEGAALRQRVRANGERFRRAMTGLGFDLVAGEHPIIPVMLGDAALASRMADALLAEGVYVIGFSYPVVPKGKARIRTQMSAAHTTQQVDQAVAAFANVGRALGIIR